MIARTFTYRALAAGLLLALVLVPASADAKKKTKEKKPGPASASLEDYLKRVRAAGVDQPATTGSLWVSTGLLANANADYKARAAGDLITVLLVDKFTADTNGENKTQRQFDTKSAITGLLAQLGPSNSMQNLFNANSNTTLDGKGQSSMSSDLKLSLAGRVVEVLPNGVLAIEATRDFTVGNDRQTVVLRGLVRPGDVGTNNAVLSSSISSLELEIKGKGAVADATRQPNRIIRLLLKVLSF